MEAPELLTQMEPVSECVTLISAWVDTHFWFLVLAGVLAVIGGLGLFEYVMRVGAGLAERVYDYYKQKRGEV